MSSTIPPLPPIKFLPTDDPKIRNSDMKKTLFGQAVLKMEDSTTTVEVKTTAIRLNISNDFIASAIKKELRSMDKDIVSISYDPLVRSEAVVHYRRPEDD